MGFYLLYDHFDHLLDEVEFAQRAYRTVYAYVNSWNNVVSRTVV